MPDEPVWPASLGPAFHAAVRVAERRSRMTYRELDAVLPEGDYSSKQIEAVLAYLCGRGIEVAADDG